MRALDDLSTECDRHLLALREAIERCPQPLTVEHFAARREVRNPITHEYRLTPAELIATLAVAARAMHIPMTEDAGRWTVETRALALGVIDAPLASAPPPEAPTLEPTAAPTTSAPAVRTPPKTADPGPPDISTAGRRSGCRHCSGRRLRRWRCRSSSGIGSGRRSQWARSAGCSGNSCTANRR